MFVVDDVISNQFNYPFEATAPDDYQKSDDFPCDKDNINYTSKSFNKTNI